MKLYMWQINISWLSWQRTHLPISYHFQPIRRARLKTGDNTNCWWGCGVTGALTHCWRECKIVQTLWKTVRLFLRKLNIVSPYNSAFALLGIYQNELKLINMSTRKLEHRCLWQLYLQLPKFGSNQGVLE